MFVDLEKPFNRVLRWTLRWALRTQMIPEKLVRLILALYDDSKSCVTAADGLSNVSSVSVGVHQGSALSPLFFNLVMQEAEVPQGSTWDMLYADDLIITAESKEKAEQRFHLWRAALARRGLKINIDKTKILVSEKRLYSFTLGVIPMWSAREEGANTVLCTEFGKWVHKH